MNIEWVKACSVSFCESVKRLMIMNVVFLEHEKGGNSGKETNGL